ncbi:hypothetical protein WN943_023637 [Citrus x changshan-huyou]
MDTEEIAKFCKSLSISEDDGKVVSLDRSLVLLGKRQMQNYLAGKILTNKKVNMEAFKAGYMMCGKREVEDVEVRSYGDFTGRFLRLRVIVDATKPLRKCVKL